MIEKFEHEFALEDWGIGNQDDVLLGVEQRSATDRRRATRGQKIAEDDGVDQLVCGGVRITAETDGFDGRVLRDETAPAAHESLSEPIEFGAEVMHFAIAFGTKIAAILGGRELG